MWLRRARAGQRPQTSYPGRRYVRLTPGRRVTAISVQDCYGAKSLLEILRYKCSQLRRVWADQAHAGQLVTWVWVLRPWRKVYLEIVQRADGVQDFHPLIKVVFENVPPRRLRGFCRAPCQGFPDRAANFWGLP
jgi:hypothetical protein